MTDVEWEARNEGTRTGRGPDQAISKKQTGREIREKEELWTPEVPFHDGSSGQGGQMTSPHGGRPEGFDRTAVGEKKKKKVRGHKRAGPEAKRGCLFLKNRGAKNWKTRNGKRCQM